MRHATVPPPVWPSTPPTSPWGPRSWRSWCTGSVSAGSTAPSPLITVSSTSQVESKSRAWTTLSVSMFQSNRQQKPRESIIYDSPSHTLSLSLSDKIPVAVNISQKAAVNQSDNVFFRGEDVVFKVQLHDPSGYLKTAASIDYIWDFRDGNQLVTHRDVTTHTYSRLGRMSVMLVVEAAFPIECPPTAVTPTQRSSTAPPPTGTETRGRGDVKRSATCRGFIWL